MGGVFRFAQPVVLCALLLMTSRLRPQDTPANIETSTPHFGIPEDWSTQHVIYTRNGSADDKLKVRDDPRFLHSIFLHNMPERGKQSQPPSNTDMNAGSDADSQEPRLHVRGNLRRHGFNPPPPSKVDWAVSLGSTAGLLPGESPAKYTFDPTATPSCSDFAVFTIDANATVGTQANLIGLTNLYSGSSPTGSCGSAPTFLFSYALGTGSSGLSPVLSLDGKKVAWIENRGGTAAHLHVTKWVSGQGTNATTGSVALGTGASDVDLNYTNSAYSGCSAKLATNGRSDLYVDYSSDTGFVSADNGILYHVKSVFNGTASIDFCITVNSSVAADAMSGAVYDSLLGDVFISDSKSLYGYTVSSTAFTAISPNSSILFGNGSPNNTGPGPVLDAFNGYIYMFSAHDKFTQTSMSQIPTSLASSVIVPLGPASQDSGGQYLFYGAFDNNYLIHGPTNAAATLYSCGTDSSHQTAQDLFAISFLSSGLANQTAAMPANANVNPGGNPGTCSPITEFDDGTTDRIFVGMGDPGATDGANVVQMWDVTTRITSASHMPTASATSYLGGTSGLIIDNNASGTAQAESVYFSTLSTSATATTCGAAGTSLYCAVKLTQSGLK